MIERLTAGGLCSAVQLFIWLNLLNSRHKTGALIAELALSVLYCAWGMCFEVGSSFLSFLTSVKFVLLIAKLVMEKDGFSVSL